MLPPDPLPNPPPLPPKPVPLVAKRLLPVWPEVVVVPPNRFEVVGFTPPKSDVPDVLPKPEPVLGWPKGDDVLCPPKSPAPVVELPNGVVPVPDPKLPNPVVEPNAPA